MEMYQIREEILKICNKYPAVKYVATAVMVCVALLLLYNLGVAAGKFFANVAG